jgi:hypothetical protein
MAEKHPYISGSGPLFQIFAQLRKSFPAGGVTANTLKKLGLAPNNESYVINVLRFIGVVDGEGKKTEAAGKVFNQHDEAAFAKAFSELVKKAYSELFSLHGEDAWRVDLDSLIQFFRSTDDTSAIVGRRQATTFQALSVLSGHAEAPPAKSAPARKASSGKGEVTRKPKAASAGPTPAVPASGAGKGRGASEKPGGEVNLTVRIELNLPAGGDQATYDRIFKSIRENLLNGK